MSDGGCRLSSFFCFKSVLPSVVHDALPGVQFQPAGQLLLSTRRNLSLKLLHSPQQRRLGPGCSVPTLIRLVLLRNKFKV